MTNKKTKMTVREHRLVREISQEAMAERLGIHRNTYAAWEKDPGSISIRDGKRVATALGVSVDDIFFG
jgi:putative transcriptional regulator